MSYRGLSFQWSLPFLTWSIGFITCLPKANYSNSERLESDFFYHDIAWNGWKYPLKNWELFYFKIIKLQYIVSNSKISTFRHKYLLPILQFLSSTKMSMYRFFSNICLELLLLIFFSDYILPMTFSGTYIWNQP